MTRSSSLTTVATAVLFLFLGLLLISSSSFTPLTSANARAIVSTMIYSAGNQTSPCRNGTFSGYYNNITTGDCTTSAPTVGAPYSQSTNYYCDSNWVYYVTWTGSSCAAGGYVYSLAKTPLTCGYYTYQSQYACLNVEEGPAVPQQVLSAGSGDSWMQVRTSWNVSAIAQLDTCAVTASPPINLITSQVQYGPTICNVASSAPTGSYNTTVFDISDVGYCAGNTRSSAFYLGTTCAAKQLVATASRALPECDRGTVVYCGTSASTIPVIKTGVRMVSYNSDTTCSGNSSATVPTTLLIAENLCFQGSKYRCSNSTNSTTPSVIQDKYVDAACTTFSKTNTYTQGQCAVDNPNAPTKSAMFSCIATVGGAATANAAVSVATLMIAAIMLLAGKNAL